MSSDIKVNYDIHPAAIQFDSDRQTVSRKNAKSVQIPVIRSLNLKGDVVLVYKINDDIHELVMPSDMAEAVIEVPLEQVPLSESSTDLRMELVKISTADGPAELGECLKPESAISSISANRPPIQHSRVGWIRPIKEEHFHNFAKIRSRSFQETNQRDYVVQEVD